MNDERQAEIEAAMDAWMAQSERYTAMLQPGERLFWPNKQVVGDMLDAAAAIGRERVSERELQEAIGALSQAAFEHGLERGFAEYREPGDRLNAAAAKNKQARDRVFALLIAQPEPGTHDAATEGGVTE